MSPEAKIVLYAVVTALALLFLVIQVIRQRDQVRELPLWKKALGTFIVVGVLVSVLQGADYYHQQQANFTCQREVNEKLTMALQSRAAAGIESDKAMRDMVQAIRDNAGKPDLQLAAMNRFIDAVNEKLVKWEQNPIPTIKDCD